MAAEHLTYFNIYDLGKRFVRHAFSCLTAYGNQFKVKTGPEFWVGAMHVKITCKFGRMVFC